MMKYINNKSIIIVFLATIIFTSSCTFDEQLDPNRPSVNGVLSNATVSQLNNLVAATLATTRNSKGTQTTASATCARELYIFDADPRNTSDLLGKGATTQLDNDSFYSTAPFNSRYRAIKNANILLESLTNTTSITEEQKEGYRGFAKTIIGHQLIEVLKSYGQARIDVSDPLNISDFVDFDIAIVEVLNILDEAAIHLDNAGTEFTFPLGGFGGFDTPDTFLTFNRGISAVASVYSGNSSRSLDDLADSFMNLNGDLTVGPKHVFSLNPGDSTNPLFKAPQQSGDQLIVHDSWINDAELGDTRVLSKTRPRPVPNSSSDNLNGTHETALYETNTSSIDVIRNEELILVYAEASILENNLQDAEDALNVVRNAAGLPNYTGAQNVADLTTELLNQRRYSLWAENHRMFDLRRYNLSNTLPIDRVDDDIFNIFPIPFTEGE